MKRISSRFFRMCGRVGLGLVVGTLTACGGGGGGGGTGGGYEDALAPAELAAGSSSFTVKFEAVPVELNQQDAQVSLSFVCKPGERSTGAIDRCNIDGIDSSLTGCWEHNGVSVGNILSMLNFICNKGSDKIQIDVGELEITERQEASDGKIESLSGRAIKTKVSGIVSGSQEYMFNMSNETELDFTITYTYN